MNKPFAVETPTDEIDQFVEELSRHPERAEELKNALRGRLSGGTRPVAQTPREPIATDEPDDLWDNVPI